MSQWYHQANQIIKNIILFISDIISTYTIKYSIPHICSPKLTEILSNYIFALLIIPIIYTYNMYIIKMVRDNQLGIVHIFIYIYIYRHVTPREFGVLILNNGDMSWQDLLLQVWGLRFPRTKI